MRRALSNHLSCAGLASLTRLKPSPNSSYIPFFSLLSRHMTQSREGAGCSYKINWALAGRGVIVEDNAFHNLSPSELQNRGATRVECLSGVPLHVRGNSVGGASEISRAQFSRLLKQVTSHISSSSNVFVQDGAVVSDPKCDAKVRVISDSPSAVLSISSIISETPSRAVSHDSCPLTVYIASSLRQRIWEILAVGSRAYAGYAAADVERSSLILCGKAFADAKVVKDALSALAAPVISARGGIPLSARLLVIGDSMIILFASEHTVQSCRGILEALISPDAGAALTSDGVAPFFKTKNPAASNLLKRPASMIFAASDSTGALPLVSKLSPGQAAYHFLAGYDDGKFVTAYCTDLSPIDPLTLAMALFLQLKENEISSFLINVNNGGKHISGEEIIKLAVSTVSGTLPECKVGTAYAKVGDLKGKYRSFLSSKFGELPEEFSF